MAIPPIPTPSIVSQLELIADSFGCPTNTQATDSQAASTGTQQTTIDHAANVRKRRNTKSTNKTNKKNKTLSSTTPDINIADIIATKKRSVELRCLAEKHAQTGMSEEVFQSILAFHEEMQTMIAIKALELGTTVSVIEEIFGKYVGVRRPSAWNGYLQSDLAKSIFKTGKSFFEDWQCNIDQLISVSHVAGGIASGEAMRCLSAKWAAMDKSEKATYRKGIEDTTHLDQGLAELEFGQQVRDEITQPRTNIVENAHCLKKQKVAAVRLLDETLTKCIPVAKTNHFEVAIIAVSTHIAKHSFQLTRNTIGIDKALW
ncbi:hypothetical protein DFH28DRAFT_1190396 [Melampsora americana]|nr:hypothetical protein DFH28DRAFT_1190396 [Melampsora americana]